MMKRTRICLIAGALVTPLALAGCGVGEASTVDATAEIEAPVPVEIAYPLRTDLFATYDATATIATEGDAPVVARVGGDLVELRVEEGDRVAAGQVLARLDGERLELEMLAAKADLDRARGEYDRYLDLHRRGLVSEAMFDGLRYDLEALEATWELKKLELEYASVRAPITGIVSDRSVKLGQSVAAGATLFRIMDTRELVAELKIPQSELAKFAVGDAATLIVDALPRRDFAAEIIRISPTIDRDNGTFRVTLAIENADGQLAPGMFARFSIAYERHADVLTIPAAALVEEDEATSVYVVRDGKVALKKVETGVRTDGRIEVRGGLDAEDAVVVVGQSGLRDGSRVLARRDDVDRYSG